MAKSRPKPARKAPKSSRSGAAELARLRGALDETKRQLDGTRTRLRELERLVDEDPLMPVANRRAFLRELTRMMAFAQRYGGTGSLVYFDLNNLKQINDSHGHAAGDAALLQIARLLVDGVRASDVIGRLGGDEFGLLLVQADAEAAERKAAELAQLIEASPLEWQGVRVPLAVAYGVRAFTGGENAERVLAAADRAMYRRKRKSS
ncbi:MAG TPA: GGDEF domain-containing protein [Stellaceae bacterium]|nr:GGDEF domain-containing protein [Stellaceae bacterium]